MKYDYYDSNKGNSASIVIKIITAVLLVSVVAATCIFIAIASKDVTKNETYVNNNENDIIENSTEPNNQVEATSDPNGFSQLYKDNCESVVIVRTYVDYNGQLAEYGLGSGFFVTDDGYVMTNSHVIESATAVKVVTFLGEELEAKIIGFDERTEVGVLKVEGKFNPVTIADSDKIEVGEYAIAIGAPLGYKFSMSVGFVSAVERTFVTEQYKYKTIQIDTALNQGNSGGPLFNAKGEVIGITTFKQTYSAYSNSTAEGVAFAIPSNTAKKIGEQLIKDGKVTRPAINATVRTNLDENNNFAGVYVYEVNEGGAAFVAGLMKGDIIVKYNDAEITQTSDLMEQLDNAEIGEKAKLEIIRSGAKMNIEITLGST